LSKQIVFILTFRFLCTQIAFEGIRGRSYLGDIAIDDVSIKDGACPAPGSCNFETDFCTWTNIMTGDDFDWLRNKGATGSARTGPSVDHTVGNANGKTSHSLLNL
jgi:hypothetical protein